MAPSEYAAMERGELEDKLAESRKELFNLRFQKATGQLDNTARLSHVKRDVARILTELRRQDEDGDDGWQPAATAATSRRGTGRDVEADVEADDAGDVEDEEEA